MAGLAVWERAVDQATSAYPGITDEDLPTQVVRFMINHVVLDLVETSRRQIAEAGVQTIDDVRAAGCRLIGFSEPLAAELRQWEDFLMETVYKNWRVMRMTTKAKRIVKGLFDAYLEDTHQLPPNHSVRLDAEGPHRVICDYIAGMPDRYAQDEYRKLFFPYERV